MVILCVCMCVRVCTFSVLYLRSSVNYILIRWDQMQYGTKVQTKDFEFQLQLTALVTKSLNLPELCFHHVPNGDSPIYFAVWMWEWNIIKIWNWAKDCNKCQLLSLMLLLLIIKPTPCLRLDGWSLLPEWQYPQWDKQQRQSLCEEGTPFL